MLTVDMVEVVFTSIDVFIHANPPDVGSMMKRI